MIDRVTIVIMAAKRGREKERGKGESRQKEEHLGDLERSRNETTTKTMVRSTSKYVAASLALALALAMAAGASAQDYEEYDYEVLPEVPQEFADSMKEYAEEDTGACDPIPRSLWNTTVRDGKDQDCEGWWQSIAGDARSVADDIGQSFADGAPLLMQSGNVSTCVTPLDFNYNFSLNVKSACWPAGTETEPEGNHVARVTLELPLQCYDENQAVPLEDIPEQTILVQGDVALCGDDAGEDQRSYRQVADNQ